MFSGWEIIGNESSDLAQPYVWAAGELSVMGEEAEKDIHTTVKRERRTNIPFALLYEY